MLYFTPKADLRTVEALFALEQRYLEAYFQLLQYAESKHMPLFPFNVFPQEVQQQHLEHAKAYSDLRACVNEYVHPLERLTERYGAVDPTSYFLETTKLPDYGSGRPSIFNAEDKAYWLDKTHALRGAIKFNEARDFRHLVNPFYWVYAFFHSVLSFTGIGKLVGEEVAKAVSVSLTAATTAASPWIKQLVVAWFKHFSGK